MCKVKNKNNKTLKTLKTTLIRLLYCYNQFHNILRLFDVLPNFPFTTSETMGIITYKHGIYKLPHELRSNLRLRILGN